MRVLVILLAEHREVVAFFERKAKSLLEPLFLRTFSVGAPQVTFCSKLLAGQKGVPLDLADLILEKVLEDGKIKIDSVLVLYEKIAEEIVRPIRSAIFSASFYTGGYIPNIGNFLTGQFSRLLKNYSFYSKLTEDKTKKVMVGLPLRNFQAEEFCGLQRVCTEQALDANFQNNLNSALSHLARLRGPKRRSKYPTVYWKDSRGLYFEYGHERHARYEVGGAHHKACHVNGLYRFGSLLDQEHHYNVTEGDSDDVCWLIGNFTNCHEEQVITRKRTHINMFSNDFHKA